jgi:hypothetical protein
LVEAQPLPLRLVWSARLDPAEQQELDRLRQEADRVEFNGRHHVLHFGLAAIRAVQLYRVVLHELGHWAQYYEQVELPSLRDNADFDNLWEAYWRRPESEHESFADRYALELAEDLKARGRIPFDRILTQLAGEGLSPQDYIGDPGREPAS